MYYSFFKLRLYTSILKDHQYIFVSIFFSFLLYYITLFLFFISYSCGYQKAFDQYSSILSEKYPHIHIDGANYDPSMVHLLAAKILVCRSL